METFEIIAQKSRRKRLWKTVAVSLACSLVLFILGGKGLSEITSHNGRSLMRRYEVLSEIAYPNVDYDSLYFNPSSLLSGRLHSDRFKNLDGVRVPYQSYEAGYSLTGAYTDTTMEGTYLTPSGFYTRQNRQKYPVFYNINAKKTKDSHPAPQELPQVQSMSNQLVEVALTFDKPYSYAEIQKMIPDNLKINWYWIGSQNQDGENGMNLISDPGTSYGVSSEILKTLPDDGSKDAQAARQQQKTFLDYLREADKSLFPTINNYSSYSDIEAYLQRFGKLDIRESKDRDQLTFAGLILTGKAENFAQLEGRDWITASSIGASAPNHPYYKLDKE